MFEIYDVAILPIIIGLVELFKKVGVPAKALPFIALILGVAIGITYIAPGDIKQGLIVGVMLGLSASGLYSGTKNTIE